MSYTYTWSQPGASVSSYASPYPAPSSILRLNENVDYPHQAVVPLSSYSSLAGALDNNAVMTHSYSQPIYKPKSSSSHPHSISQDKLLQRNSPYPNSTQNAQKYYREEPITYAPLTRIPREPRPSGPTNHILVPQPEFREPDSKRPYSDPYFRHPPITFQATNIPELGVRVGKVMEKYSPSIVGGQDMVLATVHEKEIRFWILWPGYSADPVQKRMKTQNGKISRDTVLMILANALLDFTRTTQKKQLPVDRGYENWAVGTRPDCRLGIDGSRLFITRLLHRGGSNWQPEIWAPREL